MIEIIDKTTGEVVAKIDEDEIIILNPSKYEVKKSQN